MKYYTIFIACIFSSFISNQLNAQADKSKILEVTQSNQLMTFAAEKRITANKERSEAIEWAIRNGRETKNLKRLVNGIPLYIKDFNSAAAATTNTDDVHNLGLTGQNFSIGIWEAGGVPRVSHENFNTVTVLDGTTQTTNHASHVAGTLAGNGSNNSTAKGMAPSANLRAYNAVNDISEMATEASNGMLVSNHSYGFDLGWRFNPGGLGNPSGWDWDGSTPYSSAGQSPWFGQYLQEAVDYDVVAYNAPFYSIFVAAGNDRNNNPSVGSNVRNGNTGTYTPYNPSIHPGGDGIIDNGFDCLPGDASAKNVIAVGAIDGNSGNAMTTFSSWGGTDDGRIKPDIVAPGRGLLSSGSASNSHYYVSSGTSMSSPTVAGSALLLQEYYEDLFGTGNFMRSATLKALIIHTATDLGNVGPDYAFGWGMMNTKKAYDALTESSNGEGTTIITSSVSNASPDTYYIASNGCNELRSTLAYTDVQGVPQTGLDNATSVLVNDLDLRVIELGGVTNFPWILNPANPNGSAFSGDNDRDNVEQIILNSHNAGVYSFNIEAEGTINSPTNSQNYSLLVSGAEEYCNLLPFPNHSGGALSSGSYCHPLQIRSQRTIAATESVTYTAKNEIKLEPGFRAVCGSKFSAKLLHASNCN